MCFYRLCMNALVEKILLQLEYIESRILESLAGYHTIFLFAVFCKIGALECNVH